MNVNKEMKPTIKNLKKIIGRPNEIDPYAKYFIRPISIWFTWFFVRTPLSANHVTIIQEIFGITGGVLFACGRFVHGAIFLQLGFIMDNSDGEVARWKNQQSERGKFLDLVGHMVVIPFYFFGLGLGLYLQQGNIITLIMGLLAGLFSLKLEKLITNKDGDLELARHGFFKSLFRYPDSMNIITILAIIDWLFKSNLLFYCIIIYGFGMTMGRMQQIYKTFYSINN
ncbi:MAG: CDP-alcohol phosphatidyltransferase family protein [Candidatus Neomarinimicrobiota bacterium]